MRRQVDRVFLALAATYDRFGPAPPPPAFLAAEPYASRVVVSVGPDHGAASKYLGSLPAIAAAAAAAPGGAAWVLFCDDDQARPARPAARPATGSFGLRSRGLTRGRPRLRSQKGAKACPKMAAAAGSRHWPRRHRASSCRPATERPGRAVGSRSVYDFVVRPFLKHRRWRTCRARALPLGTVAGRHPREDWHAGRHARKGGHTGTRARACTCLHAVLLTPARPCQRAFLWLAARAACACLAACVFRALSAPAPRPRSRELLVRVAGRATRSTDSCHGL